MEAVIFYRGEWINREAMHVAINTHYPSDGESGRVIEILAQQQQPRWRSLHKQLSHLISMPHKSSGSSHGITSEILITAAVHLKRRCRGDENVRARGAETHALFHLALQALALLIIWTLSPPAFQLFSSTATICHAENASMHRRVLSVWRAEISPWAQTKSVCRLQSG
jgi:hypothetical protein